MTRMEKYADLRDSIEWETVKFMWLMEQLKDTMKTLQKWGKEYE